MKIGNLWGRIDAAIKAFEIYSPGRAEDEVLFTGNPFDDRIKLPELKIKIKSLAAESRAIKEDELRYLPEKKRANQLALISLVNHRMKVVAPHARVAQIAYGFLKGKGYSKIEKNPRTPPDWNRVHMSINRFGSKKITWSQLKRWYKST